jgi:hypothetical protein
MWQKTIADFPRSINLPNYCIQQLAAPAGTRNFTDRQISWSALCSAELAAADRQIAASVSAI